MVGIRREVTRARRLRGSVAVPPDKSLTHRSIMLSALAAGESTIHNPLTAADCLSTASCIESLGVTIKKNPNHWTVRGGGLWSFTPPASALDCGNSGTTMRLLSGILAAQPFETILTGDESLSRRPMNRVADPLRKMGASVELTNEKFAPMRIRGLRDLSALRYKSPVSSAQVKSCILLAGLHARGETSFEEPSLSRDHTERMLSACGVEVKRDGSRVTVLGPARLSPQTWTIPGDISSAAFFIVAGLIVPGANIRLSAVNLNPTRTGILDVLSSAGARVAIQNERKLCGEPAGDLVIDTQAELHGFTVDAQVAPRLIDEIPALAVVASQAKGTSVFSGIEELRVKETDRIAAVATNLRAMGGQVEERPDGLVIHGPTPLKGAPLESFDDHRIAMAFAVAALVADGTTIIEGADCVSISFPNFWDLLQQLERA